MIYCSAGHATAPDRAPWPSTPPTERRLSDTPPDDPGALPQGPRPDTIEAEMRRSYLDHA
jgi:hypothetical protein